MSIRRATNIRNRNWLVSTISRRKFRALSPSFLLLSFFAFFLFLVFFKNTRTRKTDERENNRLLKCAIVTTTANASGKQFEQWFRWHHQILGFEMFYVFVDDRGTPSSFSARSQSLFPENVKLFRESHGDLESIRPKLRCNKEQWLVPWMRKRGCNAELFVKQSQNVEMAISMARKDNIDWIAHIDIDELLFPSGGASLDIRELLQDQPGYVDAIVFPNYEAVPEMRGGVQDPFVDATLFKRNYEQARDKDKWKKLGGEVVRNKSLPNFFLAYANGKSIARIAGNKLRSNGAHRFKFRSASSSPPSRELNFIEVTHEEAKLLHYPYMNLNESIKRLRKCSRDATSSFHAELDFLLEFDRRAYVALVLNNEGSVSSPQQQSSRRRREDWYNRRVVFEDKNEVAKLVRGDVFQRIYAPSLLLKNLSPA